MTMFLEACERALTLSRHDKPWRGSNKTRGFYITEAVANQRNTCQIDFHPVCDFFQKTGFRLSALTALIRRMRAKDNHLDTATSCRDKIPQKLMHGTQVTKR